MKTKKVVQASGLLISTMLIASCMTSPGGGRATLDNPWNSPEDEIQVTSTPAGATTVTNRSGTATRFQNQSSTGANQSAPEAEIYESSGVMVDLKSPTLKPVADAEGEITLNFQGAEISEVIKTVLGDILQANYVMDEQVRGTVNLQTSRPLTRDELIPALETLLHINGAVLLKTDNFYEVLPADSALNGVTPGAGLTPGSGYQLLILPLRYIASSEMMKILEPLKPKQGLMETDSRRNLLMVAGTSSELVNIRETVRIFDVDQLQGMSVGLFRLQSAEAEVMIEELDAIFGDKVDGPLAGLVRFVPIERLNAILVITPQKKYLRDARVWIKRLDRSQNVRGKNMYVYYVQNGKAENLAGMLGELFSGTSDNAERGDRSRRTRSNTSSAPDSDSRQEQSQEPVQAVRTSPAANAGVDGSNLEVGEVSIIADEENNALLVMASANDYDKVLQAIQKLDVLPLQVLVEATIVEVSLQDELRYGLQWFFKSSLDGGSKSAIGSLGSLPIDTPSDFFPSANFEIFDASSTRLLLNALAQDSRLKVVSSPSLMVLDNRTASIRVGDQVPVRTSETTATSSDNLNTTSTIQFKDTGVLLEVTPRVNAGGMVVLDIKQEVNDVDLTTTSGIDSPTIIQRQIETSVAVQSGETLVLGGLIKENRDRSSQGLPGLRHVPVLGWLFGSEGKNINRTELVVMITPTAVTSQEEARDVTREYQQKLRDINFDASSKH
ncbi:type II secretion system secretin GspD [Pontibacter sp. JAM-7]|uniref:type II secretion system secretin GspD n=1 Tax=Pontibacter sp. JAM-7 TaxID=3366581 RepID=UPI003AF41819